MKHVHAVSVAKANAGNNTVCDVVDQYLGFLGLQSGLLCGILAGFVNGILNQFKPVTPPDNGD